MLHSCLRALFAIALAVSAWAIALPALAHPGESAALVAGGFHNCARLNDGTVRCWGDNFDGQLGDGGSTDRLTPVAVSGLANATALVAGHFHTCALLTDGTVRCWGDNWYGQLGDGSSTWRLTPVAVRDRKSVV